ncbi:unnamed protein product [Prunus armeniaca]|uniref:Uncharacterized protein n=1 Tax=Prunus armeniaca TaxID=36596 RepID=A0A6J5V5K3_PRUAR|nr:unnamed protein product [Prunus armeniaca]
MMRRQGQYGDSGVNTYAAAAPMHHMSGQRMEHKSSHFEGRLEAFTPERDNPYASSKSEGQWRWERDGSKGSNPMVSHMYNEGKCCCQLSLIYVYAESGDRSGGICLTLRRAGPDRVDIHDTVILESKGRQRWRCRRRMSGHNDKLSIPLYPLKCYSILFLGFALPCSSPPIQRAPFASPILPRAICSHVTLLGSAVFSLAKSSTKHDLKCSPERAIGIQRRCWISRSGQGGDTSRSYFQGQRPDPKLAMEKQNNNDSRSQSHNEDMDLGYEDKPSSQTFEELEQKFLDDIRKLTKEQNDAEDAENARHKEKIGAINAQYEEQLVALRARQASRRDELLRRESNARQHQYQQSVMDCYPNSSMGPSELRGYGGVAASAAGGEGHRAYNTDQYESYRERARFLGGSRDHGFEPRGPYPGGRVYDTGSRYY